MSARLQQEVIVQRPLGVSNPGLDHLTQGRVPRRICRIATSLGAGLTASFHLGGEGCCDAS